MISEWSMYTLTVARDLQGTGGPIWDLKANPTRGWWKKKKKNQNLKPKILIF